MKSFLRDQGRCDTGTTLVLLYVISLLALSLVPVPGSPQTHDADLKIAQAPPLVWGRPPDFHHLRTKLTGDITPIDLRFFSGGIETLDLGEVTSIASGEYAFDGIPSVTGLSGFLALLPTSDVTLQLSDCAITDVSPFVAIFNSASESNLTLKLDHNPINAALGACGRTGGGSCLLSLTHCGITGVGTLGDLTSMSLFLNDNAIASLDLSAGAVSLDGGQLAFSRNPLATVSPGNGLTTGIVTANGAFILFDDDQLSSAQVNGILDAIATMAVNTGSVGYLDLSTGANGAPTGGGLDDVDTLTGMGWTITTN